MMRIRVLGSAAGGGFPQWNCGWEAVDFVVGRATTYELPAALRGRARADAPA